MLLTDKEFIIEFNQAVYNSIQQSNYSLISICNELHLSRSQVHRRIKSITGLSATHYIRRIRMQYAAHLLTNHEIKIVEISAIVGIKSVQNFSKYFKCEFGISPSQYKCQVSYPTNNSNTSTVFFDFKEIH